MNPEYYPEDIESKWQAEWDRKRLFNVSEQSTKQKYYVLSMFPYPSGELHMGHMRNYTIVDVIARYKMMQGFNVLNPIGWDAFGMPAENAAIKNHTHPSKWTLDNIANMRIQMKKLGISFDWEREVITCLPEYYQWEQKLFIELYKKGLIYRKSGAVNWCNDCQTVLANEQVENGKCWRCEKQVLLKDLYQWYFKITQYAEELLNFTDRLPFWPKSVLTMQKNWIGKSVGAEVYFNVENSKETITIFTTRQDTLWGCTFVTLAPEHPLTTKLSKGTKHEQAVSHFVEKMRKQNKLSRTFDNIEKEGVFVGTYAINPVNGERIPIYTANFVLMDYGTGAVMAVPAHDQRDFDFAKKYYLDIKRVIRDERVEDTLPLEKAYTEAGVLIHSGEFIGKINTGVLVAIADFLEARGFGKKAVNFKLKDWCVSRQRYWGTPIPMVHCSSCGIVPVSLKELPVVLPYDVPLTGEGGSPLGKVEDFINIDCPSCGGKARRETDTMDTFVESSWYYARYIDPLNQKCIFDKSKADYWLPVDQYVGGIEHACMHLLYFRFFHKLFRDLGFLSGDEPNIRLLTQGMVIKDGAKMSKSKGNVVNLGDFIKEHGTDPSKLFSLFAAPPEKELEWNEQGVEGCRRFLNRVWKLVYKYKDLFEHNEQFNLLDSENEDIKQLKFWIHKTIDRVTHDIEDDFHFNTAISAIMEYVNFLTTFEPKNPSVSMNATIKESVETLVLLLGPFAAHISEELWVSLGHEMSVMHCPWPKVDSAWLKRKDELIVIQVNGKLRGKITVPINISDEELKKLVFIEEKVKEYVGDKPIKKFIVVPHKLVNIVV